MLEGHNIADARHMRALLSRATHAEAHLASITADRDWNHNLKMRFEATLRHLESKRRLKRGTVDRLIGTVPG